MAQVDIDINGRSYSIACDDGQEEHLSELGGVVNDKVASLIASAGQIGDTRLLLMASLLIADDLADSIRKLNDVGETPFKAVESTPPVDHDMPGYDEQSIIAALDNSAERMQSIAEMLEQS
jgi:cell division protein ZapA